MEVKRSLRDLWYRVYVYEEHSTQEYVRKKVDSKAPTFAFILLITLQVSTLILRHLLARVTLVSVLELHQIPIWMHIVFLKVLKCKNRVNS
jgi:hypothetical protein